MTTDLNDAALVLLLNASITAVKHLWHNIFANIVLIHVRDDDITEALDWDFLGLLLIKVPPVPVHHSSKLDRGSECYVLIDRLISADLENRWAIVRPALRFSQELLSLLTQGSIGAHTSSQRLLQTFNKRGIHRFGRVFLNLLKICNNLASSRQRSSHFKLTRRNKSS